MLLHTAVLVKFVLFVATLPSGHGSSTHPHQPTDITPPFKTSYITSTSFNPPFTLTRSLVNSSNDHFALFKNSPLSDLTFCSLDTSGRNRSATTSHSQVKSQSRFCSHLVPGTQYVVLWNVLSWAVGSMLRGSNIDSISSMWQLKCSIIYSERSLWFNIVV